MDAVNNLMSWAQEAGVVQDGIEARLLPGRGVGFVATRHLEPDQAVLTVPSSALRTISNTPRPILRKLKGATVHAILSASICLDTTSSWPLWAAVIPPASSFTASVPLCWPAHIRNLLPDVAQQALAKQEAKFYRDWALVSAAYPPPSPPDSQDQKSSSKPSTNGNDVSSKKQHITRSDFLYAWLIVNTRSFYHTTSRTQRSYPNKDDHMVLQPVADLFNHDGRRGCAVAYDKDDYTITTRHAHAAGDEVYIEYGAHSNDMLMVEYGFTLGSDEGGNPWDEISLDAYLCPRLDRLRGCRWRLETAGFWEGYKLDARGVCYRTEVALRMIVLGDGKEWTDLIEGRRDEDEDRQAANKELVSLLRAYEKDIRKMLHRVDTSQSDDDDDDDDIDKYMTARDMIKTRWLQMKHLVVKTLSDLDTEPR